MVPCPGGPGPFSLSIFSSSVWSVEFRAGENISFLFTCMHVYLCVHGYSREARLQRIGVSFPYVGAGNWVRVLGRATNAHDTELSLQHRSSKPCGQYLYLPRPNKSGVFFCFYLYSFIPWPPLQSPFSPACFPAPPPSWQHLLGTCCIIHKEPREENPLTLKEPLFPHG